MSCKTIEPRKIGRVGHLHLFPIKSCTSIELETAYITNRGLETISRPKIRDREYMVVDATPEKHTGHHKFLTQRDRDLQKMALITPILRGSRLELSWDNQDRIEVPVILAGKEIPVKVHSDLTSGVDQGDDVAKMLTDYLLRPVRLVRASGSFRRMASQSYKQNSNTLSWQDVYSINWLFQESVNELQVIMGYDISYKNFRPNIVGTGGSPNSEHSLYHVRFGTVAGVQPKPSTRCMMINVNQESGVMQRKRPFALQAICRNFNWIDMNDLKQPIFAENFLPTTEGRIDRLDDIVATSLRDPPIVFGDRKGFRSNSR